MSKLEKNLPARQCLLEAAGAVFAEKGFAKATVREICERAGTNVAAINYYFRDKEGLYRKVMNHWSEVSYRKYPPDLGLGPTATAEERLAAFIRSFLLRLLDKSQPGWHGKLMTREMAEPTKALDDLIGEFYRPLNERLDGIVRALVGPAATDDVVRLCTRSVLAQCVYYRHARLVIQRMTPGQRFESADIEQLAQHITQFSLAGIRQAGGN